MMALRPGHQANPTDDLPVRLSQTTVLEPRMETFVPCETACPFTAPLMLISQRSALADKSLMVSPAVINTGKCRVLVSNPSDRTEVLYKDQVIAFAVRLAQSDDGTLSCPSATPYDAVPMDAVSVETDAAPSSTATPGHEMASSSDISPTDTASLQRSTSPVPCHVVASPGQSSLDVSANSNTLGDRMTTPMDTSDTQQVSATSSGHAVASTDLSCTSPKVVLSPTGDVDMATISDYSTHGEPSSDELLASDAEMRSVCEVGRERGSSLLVSSDSASSDGCALPASNRQPASANPLPSRFRSGGFGTAPSFTFSQPSQNLISGPFQSGSSPGRRVLVTPPAPRRGTASQTSRPRGSISSPRRGATIQRGVRAGRTRGSRDRATAAAADRRPKATSQNELPDKTPEGFWHYLIDRHPWAQYVKPRQLRLHELAAQQVTNVLPEDVYRFVPPAGYLSLKFVRSLFPRVTPPDGLVATEIPFLELPSLEDAIVFRGNSADIIQEALRGAVQPARQPPDGLQTPKGEWTSRIAPRYIKGLRPVIYQIVAIKSNSLVLEAKDFFIFMPDRLDLHCILLDKFAFNVENGKYGYDRSLISVKDFVWVYDLMPVAAVLASPAADLERARIPRTAALDTNSTFFFRVARFAFVTPPTWTEPRYGIVLSITRRGQYVNNFRVAIEGTPEAVTIARSLCRFDWPNISEYEILRALCRRNSSCAVRFSEPPASKSARDTLSRMVKHFLPANPGEAIVPMEVFKIDSSEAQWFSDRLAAFDNFCRNRHESLTRMGRIFNAASSALAAFVSMDDDKETHRVTATIPSLLAYPLRMEFILNNMNTEAGWTRHRPVGVWLMGAFSFVRMTVEAVTQLRATRELRIRLQAYSWSHKPLLRATHEVGRIANNTAFLEACVKLGKLPSNAIPAYEAVTRMALFSDIPAGSKADAIMNAVYGATPLGCLNKGQNHLWPIKVIVDESPISIQGRTVHLTDDQRQAITHYNSSTITRRVPKKEHRGWCYRKCKTKQNPDGVPMTHSPLREHFMTQRDDARRAK
ncbi:hypothetical protein OSTOST_05270 [Ostertagia ostertagi]